MINLIEKPFQKPSAYVDRTALCEEIAEEHDITAILLIAAKGYGKTTLLQEYGAVKQAQGSNRVLFESLQTISTEEDTREIVAAVKRCAEETPSSAFVLLIDDLHLLQDELCFSLFDELESLALSNLQIVLAADHWTEPLLAVGLYFNFQAFETEALKFDDHQSREYLSKSSNHTLSDAQIARIVKFTDGWQSGLMLLSVNPMIDAQTWDLACNKYLNAYFSVLVSDRCSKKELSLLQRLSLFDELNPELCSYALKGSTNDEPCTPSQIAEFIDAMLAKGLFLSRPGNSIEAFALMEKPFRYWLQHAFSNSDFEKWQAIHQRASRWYATNGNQSSSIKHMLLSGESSKNFTEIWQLGLRARIGSGRVVSQQEINYYPYEDINENPAFAVLASWFFIRRGRIEDARESMLHAQALLTKDETWSEEELKLLTAHINSIRAKILNLEERDDEYIGQAEKLLDSAEVKDMTSLRCILIFSLAESWARKNDHRKALACLKEAYALSQIVQDLYAQALAIYHLADHYARAGNLLEAERICKLHLDEGDPSYRGLLHIQLTRIYLMQAEESEAFFHLALAKDLLNYGNSDFQAELELIEITARLLTQKNYEKTIAELTSALIGLRSEPIAQRSIEARFNLLLAQVYLLKDDCFRAREILGYVSAAFASKPFDYQMLQCRLAVLDDKFDTASDRLSSAEEVLAEQPENVLDRIRLLLCRSFYQKNRGDGSASYLSFADAVDLGSLYGMMEPFILEESWLIDIVNDALSNRKLKRRSRRFCEELLKLWNAADPSSGTLSTEQSKKGFLTRREQEILALLNRGMSRKEIAADLGISYNTVKVHISHIYDKLGVKNKLDAFHEARKYLHDTSINPI